MKFKNRWEVRTIVLLKSEGQLLLVHEEGGTIAAFAIRPDGRLSPLARSIAVSGATFLLAAG